MRISSATQGAPLGIGTLPVSPVELTDEDGSCRDQGQAEAIIPFQYRSLQSGKHRNYASPQWH